MHNKNELSFMREMRDLSRRLNGAQAAHMELPDNMALVMDRSDWAMSHLKEAIRQANEHGVGHVYSRELQEWIRSPVHGHFMIEVFNRIDKKSVKIAGDDFHEVLDQAGLAAKSFLSTVNGNGRLAWVGLLSPVMGLQFEQWARHQERLHQSESAGRKAF